MEVGREFISWESFQNALEQYSQENKVVYIVGTCKPVETANKNELLQYKFPVRFKYCFARMVCKHFGNYPTKSMGQRPNQRTCKTGCTSSIMVSVNTERTGLVIKEANLQHSHAISDSIFSSYSQTRRLHGEERRMASILLRAGVPLLRVQEFISHACHKDPTLKDLQNLRSSSLKASGPLTSSFCGDRTEEFAFLNDVDKLMAEDSGSIVEIINFDLVPGAIYIQTSSMIESTKTLDSGQLQVITHVINEGKVSVVSIVGVDTNQEPHVLALCVIMVSSDSALRCFFEAFVRNNSDFCDSVKGIVLDCSKENAEFFQQLIPQAYLAWSQSYVLSAWAQEAKSMSDNGEQHLDQFKCLMNAESKEDYGENLKTLMTTMKSSDYEEFLRTWDATKQLWALHEISSFPFLQHQHSLVDVYYLSMMKVFLKTHMTSSELIRALLRFVRNDTPGVCEAEKSSLELDPSFQLYRQICFPAAYHATESQIVLSLHSVYEIKQHTDTIVVKRKDSQEEYVLDLPVTKCTCPYFLEENLPCQHIFAWLKFSDKPLFDESLIPIKWQVFGTAITLGAIAESLAQGSVPSSLEHDERIKEVQNVLRNILASSCSHSYQQMGRDINLLRQVLALMKSSSSYDATVLSKETNLQSAQILPQGANHKASEINSPTVSGLKKLGRPFKKRGRGRPSNKEKLLWVMQEEEEEEEMKTPQELSSPPSAKKKKLDGVSCASSPSPFKHNLRRNIKHMFVNRETSYRAASTVDNEDDVYVGNDDAVPGCSISVVQVEEDDSKIVTSVLNEERTEIYRAVRPKASLMLHEPPPENAVESASLHQVKEADSEIVEDSDGSRFMSASQANEHQSSEKKSLVEAQKHSVPEEQRSFDSEAEASGDDSEADSDECPANPESFKEKRQRRNEELAAFMGEFSNSKLDEVLQDVSSLMNSQADQDRQGNNVGDKQASQRPGDELINSCEEYGEVDFVSSYLSGVCPGFNHYAYQVASALFCKANLLQIPVTSLLQTLSFWPNHLTEFPISRPFEGEVTLNPGQTLTLCGHKLDQEDMDSLRPGMEISSETVHAYLEILAQKHSGKMFVLPFSVVHLWRHGAYTDMLFKKVHFKTFDYLLLPIHCGGEFTPTECEEGILPQPCWMVLVADVKARTVSVLNPRAEDCYTIAANGYMLHWRRYMQVRSIHTREMLSAWTAKHIQCNKISKEGFSAVMLLMNVEALIHDVHPAVMQPMAHSSLYRQYVAACLRDMDWQATVLCVGGPECQRLAAQDADWLQCENCRAWWHRACAVVGSSYKASASSAAATFYCTSCRQRILALGTVDRKVLPQHKQEGNEERSREKDESEEEEEEEEEERGDIRETMTMSLEKKEMDI